MRLWLSGVTSKPVLDAYRKAGVEHVELDWFQATRQFGKGAQDFLLGLLDEGFKVGVYSGAKGAVEATKSPSVSSVLERYLEEVVSLADQLEWLTDFDLHPVHPPSKIYEVREQILEAMPEDCIGKLMPILSEPWHSASDIEYDVWGRIGVPPKKSEDLIAVIERYQQSATFHAMNVADFSDIGRMAFKDASTNVAAYGARFGAVYDHRGGTSLTRLFDGNITERKRAMIKDRLRERVKALDISFNDFYAETIEAITTWNAHQVLSLERELMLRPRTIAYWLDEDPAEGPEELVVTKTELQTVKKEGEAALSTLVSDPKFAIGRKCDTCDLAKKCPLYQPASHCRIDHVPAVDTPADVQRLHQDLIAIAYRRLSFSALQEQLDGGRSTPEVDAQIKEMGKLLSDYGKANSTGGFKIEAKGERAVGVLGQIFGAMAGAPMNGSTASSRAVRASANREALQQQMRATDQAEIIDVEVVEDDDLTSSD